MDLRISMRRQAGRRYARGAPARGGPHAMHPWWEQSRWPIPAFLRRGWRAGFRGRRGGFAFLVRILLGLGWVCGLDAPAVNDLLEDRVEAGEILRRTAQCDRVDKP